MTDNSQELKLGNDMDMGLPGGVCSFWRLYNFGETQPVVRSKTWRPPEYDPVAKDVADFKKKLRELCLYRGNDRIFAGSAVLAVVTDSQPKAYKLLLELGFYKFRVPVYPKYAHGISYMIIDMPAFMMALGKDFYDRQQAEQAEAEKNQPTQLGEAVFIEEPDGWDFDPDDYEELDDD